MEKGPREGRVHRPGGPSGLQGKLGGCPLGLTVSGHAQGQAFLQAAVLASVPAGAVDGAVLLAGAGVGHATVLAAAEETLGSKWRPGCWSGGQASLTPNTSSP